MPWPFLRVSSKRLASCEKNCGISIHYSIMAVHSDHNTPRHCSSGLAPLCMCRVLWFMRHGSRCAVNWWDARRQCGAERRGNATQTSDFLNFFCDNQSLDLTICAKRTEGPNCPQICETSSVIRTSWTKYLCDANLDQILEITVKLPGGATVH